VRGDVRDVGKRIASAVATAATLAELVVPGDGDGVAVPAGALALPRTTGETGSERFPEQAEIPTAIAASIMAKPR